MDLMKRIASVFPEEDDIPIEFKFAAPQKQREYLVDGDMLHWSGPCQEVLAPICIQTTSGLSPKILGHYPLLTEKESPAILDAAVKTYDHDSGLWPTMSVEGRIRHLEEFTHRMVGKRN
jgi:glyceraldehyde-3-phosphate dehydrogenase (NADP+)